MPFRLPHELGKQPDMAPAWSLGPEPHRVDANEADSEPERCAQCGRHFQHGERYTLYQVDGHGPGARPVCGACRRFITHEELAPFQDTARLRWMAYQAIRPRWLRWLVEHFAETYQEAMTGRKG